MPNLLIEKVVYGGKGIGRLDNIIHFCPYVLPGEIVSIKPLSKKKNYIEAIPNKLIKAAKKRVKPICPYFTKCGGCDYQHIDYQEQINIKKSILIEIFIRIGKLKLDNIEVFPSKHLYNYRNRIQLKLRNMKLGFYEKQSNNIVPINSCAIVDNKINEMLVKLVQITQFFINVALDIHIVTSKNGATVLKILFLQPDQLTDKIINNFINFFKNDVSGLVFYEKNNKVFRQIFSHGDNYIKETFSNTNFKINVDSFFQINTDQLKNIMAIVTDYIKSYNFQKAADLYCGVGTFSITASKFIKEIIAIENNKSAIDDALYNAKINNCNNITFINKNVESTLNLLKESNCELIILDPPRSGVNNKNIVDSIAKTAKSIIYIACDPSKQARDIKRFIDKGFYLKKAMLIDMFPQTYHIESVCILERKHVKNRQS